MKGGVDSRLSLRLFSFLGGFTSGSLWFHFGSRFFAFSNNFALAGDPVAIRASCASALPITTVRLRRRPHGCFCAFSRGCAVGRSRVRASCTSALPLTTVRLRWGFRLGFGGVLPRRSGSRKFKVVVSEPILVVLLIELYEFLQKRIPFRVGTGNILN